MPNFPSADLKDHASHHADLGRHIRAICRFLSFSGISYAQIGEGIIPPGIWTDTAIKQFVNRDTQARFNSKVLALGRRAFELVREHKLVDQMDAETQLSYERVAAVANDDTKFASENISEEIGQRFQNLRKRTGALLELPEYFAFVRYGRDAKRIVVILVETEKSGSGYAFSMKINGSRRRVIVGDVVSTHMNTHFTGIAYQIDKDMTPEEFSKLDCFDFIELNQLISKNPIGIEFISLSNSQLSEPVAPACFAGLDGSGNPVSGIGLIVIEDKFESLGIKMFDTTKDAINRNVSFLVCASDSTLSNELEKIKASTIFPNWHDKP